MGSSSDGRGISQRIRGSLLSRRISAPYDRVSQPFHPGLPDGKIHREEIIRVLELVGLSPKLKKPVSKYSLGMRQRLGIAQAIMEDPGFLILDEPFNGLDKNGVAQIRQVLLDLKKKGKTILLASHNMQDIEVLCDTVCEWMQASSGRYGDERLQMVSGRLRCAGSSFPYSMYAGTISALAAGQTWPQAGQSWHNEYFAIDDTHLYENMTFPADKDGKVYMTGQNMTVYLPLLFLPEDVQIIDDFIRITIEADSEASENMDTLKYELTAKKTVSKTNPVRQAWLIQWRPDLKSDPRAKSVRTRITMRANVMKDNTPVMIQADEELLLVFRNLSGSTSETDESGKQHPETGESGESETGGSQTPETDESGDAESETDETDSMASETGESDTFGGDDAGLGDMIDPSGGAMDTSGGAVTWGGGVPGRMIPRRRRNCGSLTVKWTGRDISRRYGRDPGDTEKFQRCFRGGGCTHCL